MDSLTQIVLGAAVAGAIAPARHRRAALLAGAGLGTLPDLDALALMLMRVDPVQNMTWHRSLSHSLLVLAPLAVAIWAFFRSRGGRVTEAPKPWFWAILLALVTHPLLDAFTVYGTQLLWPLPTPPVMWSSLFIIDPLYTLPLLVAGIVAWVKNWRPGAQTALVAGLAISTAYIGWSLVAKLMVERAAEQALVERGLQDAPRFSVPMPFTTLLWRVVVMTPEGYLEGERSVVADSGVMRFREYRSDIRALEEVGDYPAVRRLLWFNHAFMKAEEHEGRLLLSDLRMGMEPDYTFRFAVAQREGEGWREIPVEQLTWPWDASRRLPALWRRIWTGPEAGPATGATP